MTEAVSRWKDYWLTLPDSVFFEAIRTFPLDLPPAASFNKHKMVDALIRFFSDEKNKKTVIDSLDFEDRKLLSAVVLFRDLPPADLYFFFRNGETEERFFFRLVNLEERLLIYRSAPGKNVLPNPILEPDFREKVISTDYFFSKDADALPPEPAIPLLSDSLLLSIAAFLAADRKALRSNGELRKKPGESLLKRIHAENESIAEAEFAIGLILSFFKRTGILTEAETGLVFDPLLFTALRNLPLRDLLFQIMACDCRLPKSFPLPKSAALLYALVRETGQRESCSEDDFISLFYLLSGCSSRAETEAPLYRDVLTECRFLLKSGNRFFPNPLLNPDGQTPETCGSVIRDDGQILYSPGSNPRVSFYLPLFADIDDLNFFPVFRITRSSLFRAFDAGLTPQETALRLKELSAHPLPPALEKKVITAFESYREVKIWTGVTVVLPPVKAAAAEKLPALKKLAIGRPCETVFIFPEESFPEVAKELSSLGIAHIPALPRTKSSLSAAEEIFSEWTELSLPFRSSDYPTALSGTEITDTTEPLRHLLKEKPYSERTKEDLETKIRKKIILFPEQLDLHARHKDSSFASGLDFVRKLNLIKSAMKDSSYLLEISFFTDNGKAAVPAVPVELKRLETRTVLFYKIPGREEVLSLDAGKIVSLRLIRSSLRLY